MSVAHPLDSAWLRFRRADRHLSEASALIHEFGNACKHHIVADNDVDPWPTIAMMTAPDLDPMLAVVISDAIHNMRAALDYIVFELARQDSGKLQNGTQFLIEDVKVDASNSKRGFDARSGNI